MLLAVDIGNSNICFGVFDNDLIIAKFRLTTEAGQMSDEYLIKIRMMLEFYGIGCQDIKKCLIASVVPNVQQVITRAATRLFKNGSVSIVTQQDCGLQIKLPNPNEVGIDRLIDAMYALKQIVSCNVIVIDFGTAITFEVVLTDGSYEGGFILAGTNMCVKGLHQNTAKLPLIDPNFSIEEFTIGKTTKEAMLSGLTFSYRYIVKGFIQDIKKFYGLPFKVVATGGQASMICKGLDCVDIIDEDLTLKGINMISNIKI